MKLIVGLGNIGKEYDNTRHNVGFMSIDKIINSYGLIMNKEKFDGLYVDANINGEKVIFLKPQRYMNLSGEVIRKFVEFFKIDINDILIINDDLSLPVGKLKIKYKGSCGGHNGLRNIEQNLKTQDYKRIKIGIGSNNKYDMKDYVLGHFGKEEILLINDVVEKMPMIIKDYLNMDFDKVMSKYN